MPRASHQSRGRKLRFEFDFEFRVNDVDDLTGSNRPHGFEQVRKERAEKLDVVIRHGHDDKAQSELSEILLVFQILIDCHKDIEALLRKGHQLAIRDAAPTHPFNRLHFVV